MIGALVQHSDYADIVRRMKVAADADAPLGGCNNFCDMQGHVTSCKHHIKHWPRVTT